MSIKLVAFDWNGTILADLEGMVRANNEIMRHYKFPLLTARRFQETYDIPIKKYWTALGLDGEFFDKNSTDINTLFHRFYEPAEKVARTRAGARELLEYLSATGVSSIIFSNHVQQHIVVQLERLRIGKYFDSVLGRGNGSTGHHQKRFKEDMLADYVRMKKLKPSEVITIGDTIEEIEIGKKFGYTTVALTGGHNTTARLKEHKPDHVISGLKSLKEIIAQYE